MKVKQNQFTDERRTEALMDIGYMPENEKGFQVHELLNIMPERFWFKKTFIDWKRKTEFIMGLHRHWDGRWGYDFTCVKNKKYSDQGQGDDQLTNLLADAILYIDKYQVKPPKKRPKS